MFPCSDETGTIDPIGASKFSSVWVTGFELSTVVQKSPNPGASCTYMPLLVKYPQRVGPKDDPTHSHCKADGRRTLYSKLTRPLPPLKIVRLGIFWASLQQMYYEVPRHFRPVVFARRTPDAQRRLWSEIAGRGHHGFADFSAAKRRPKGRRGG